jgi:8-oxo-dGTP pyrophosphatase MutT (NUDIX family)
MHRMAIRMNAGGVVLNSKEEVAVVSQHGNSWSLPKGGIDPGEEALAAARREIAEETGITELQYIRDLGTYERSAIAKGGIGEDVTARRRNHFFLFTTTQMDLAPSDPVNPEARWVPIDAVAALLTHPKDKEFFVAIKDSLK